MLICLLSFLHIKPISIFAIKTPIYARYTYFTSVHTIPGTHASAAFTSKTSEVFKEENDIAPIFINERMKYMP